MDPRQTGIGNAVAMNLEYRVLKERILDAVIRNHRFPVYQLQACFVSFFTSCLCFAAACASILL